MTSNQRLKDEITHRNEQINQLESDIIQLESEVKQYKTQIETSNDEQLTNKYFKLIAINRTNIKGKREKIEQNRVIIDKNEAEIKDNIDEEDLQRKKTFESIRYDPITIDENTTIKQLITLIEDLPKPIPIGFNRYYSNEQIFSRVPEIVKLEEDASKIDIHLECLVYSLINDRMFTFEAHDCSYMYSMDTLIKNTILTIEDYCSNFKPVIFSYTRNEHEDDISSDLYYECKPDVSYYDRNNILILAGLENMTDIREASRDLDEKIGMNLDPNSLIYPFTFEYAQSDKFLDLYARDKNRNAHFISSFNLSGLIDRLRLVAQIINITRIFAGYLNQI